MGVRQRVISLTIILSLSALRITAAFAQSKDEAKVKSSASTSATPSASTPVTSNCPAPTPGAEDATRLRELPAPSGGKKFKIKLDKGGNNIGLPAPAKETVPEKDECFFVLAENQRDVVAEISFQKVQKNNKGISVWVFAPVRRSEAGKKTLNMLAVKAADANNPANAGPDRSGSAASDLLPAENPLILPAFIILQNAQHQAANVRSGLALNIPVSGFGASVETFVPKLKLGTWTNTFGLRFKYLSWSAEKFSFKRPVSNDVQDAVATGSGLQLDLVFRYPLSSTIVPRLGLFISPMSSQTEILKVSAGAVSPQNTQTLTRSGLLLGGEVEIQPASHFFLSGLFTMSLKENVAVKDETEPGEKLSGTGTATRLHLTGMAGVRVPLFGAKRVIFEGLVGNCYRSDKYSEEIAYAGQGQQKDIITFFQAGLGYIF